MGSDPTGVNPMRPNHWQVLLYGDFELIGPSGKSVQLPTRKDEAFFAVLCIHRQFGVERAEAAEILWPGKAPDKQLASLRQTLAVIRKAIGADALDVSRTHIRLSTSFPFLCDYDRADLRQSDAFMPGHDGEWFEDIRLQPISEDQPFQESEPSTIVGDFYDIAERMSRIDPRGMFAMLNGNPGLARGITYRNLRVLLDTAGSSHHFAGWAAFWRATQEDNLGFSTDLLRDALKLAKRDSDFELASEVCLELGRAYSRMGMLAEADRICGIAATVAERSQSKRAKANALRLRGTHLANWSDHEQGLKLLKEAEDLTDDAVVRAHLRVVRAHFSSSVGKYEQASVLLEEPLKLISVFGHHNMQSMALLVKATLAASGENPIKAARELELLAAKCYATGSSQVGVYAEETLAKILFLDGEKQLAKEKLISAKAGRKNSRMIMTPLEARRASFNVVHR